MNLLIDIGNTSCKVASASGGSIGRTFTCNDNDIKGFIERKFFKGKNCQLPEIIVLSSVRQDDIALNEYLESKCKRKFFNINQESIDKLIAEGDRRFEVLENMPEGMGADRVAAILAANNIFPDNDLMLFDFGTAITVEFIDSSKEDLFETGNRRKAEYLGGSISMGLNTRYKALSHFTQKIDLLSPNDYLKNHKALDINPIGFNLDTALAAGNILGIIFEIEGYIARFPKRKVIFTGGDAFYFADSIKNPIFVVYNLVLMGLMMIAEYVETNKQMQ